MKTIKGADKAQKQHTHQFLKILFTFLLILSRLQFSFSQCSQNTVPGNTINEFDWTTEYFDVFLKDEFQQTYAVQISSPFHISNISAQFNTDHFAEASHADFEASDGWEIIFYNFGSISEGVAEPSFALYNRYNGLFRFFMYLSANNGDSHQEAFISSYITELGETFKNSALLESQNAFHNTL